ncbi:MAG: prolyl oligopeptidase family serine peptidase [Planctomycetota bacterium]
MVRIDRSLWLLALCWLSSPTSAQSAPQLTLAAVQKAGAQLRPRPPRILWLPGGHDATVIQRDAKGNESLHAIRRNGKVDGQPLATAAALQAALAAPAKPPTNPSADSAPQESGPGQEQPQTFPPTTWLDPQTLRVEHDQTIWHWQISAPAAQPVLQWPTVGLDTSPFREPNVAVAPGDGHVAVRQDQQLWLIGQDGQRHRLTADGGADIVYGGAAHRAEIGITKGMFWSDDGRYLAFYREDLRPIAPYPFQDVDRIPVRPRAGRYPMAGGADSIVSVHVCDTQNGYSVVELAGDPARDLYWTNVGFGANSTVHVALVARGQDHCELVRFDARTGKRMATLLRSHDAEWVEPEHAPTQLASGSFLWWSRDSGYRHLYLHQADGTRTRAVTEGAFDVQEIAWLAPDQSRLLFVASGEDPRQRHLFEAMLAGDAVQVRQLTVERGTHACSPSPDGMFAYDVWSNLETPTRAQLLPLRETASRETASAVPLTVGNPFDDFVLPEQRFYELQSDDGDTLFGHLALPPNFDPNKRYPVLHYVYGGPHAQLVVDRWFGGAATWLQAFAAEGFIVSRLDNRGTPHRGIEFEQKTWRHLGTIEVRDQMRAVDWLKQQSFVDAERIGVHGWSFGGYMTLRLMLLHPEAFACGISGAPVTDWAMYETGYAERYMDSPQENPAGYAASSCLPLAGQLKRPLLLVHGTDDRTVMWSHTLQFVDRCIEAGVDLDYFPYPQQQHGLRGKDRVHFQNKMLRYLQRHLQANRQLEKQPHVKRSR